MLRYLGQYGTPISLTVITQAPERHDNIKRELLERKRNDISEDRCPWPAALVHISAALAAYLRQCTPVRRG